MSGRRSCGRKRVIKKRSEFGGCSRGMDPMDMILSLPGQLVQGRNRRYLGRGSTLVKKQAEKGEKRKPQSRRSFRVDVQHHPRQPLSIVIQASLQHPLLNMSHAGPSTIALHTSGTTKRLSTHAKTPAVGGKSGTPSGHVGAAAGAGAGLNKEVLNPGELCGFVSPIWYSRFAIDANPRLTRC
jgi:hypothetical protein